MTLKAWTDDAEIDALYAKLFTHLLEEMKSSATPLADCVQLLFIAKGLERAGNQYPKNRVR